MVNKTENGRERNSTGKAAGRFDSSFPNCSSCFELLLGKKCVAHLQNRCSFLFLCWSKTSNRKIEQMVIGKEVGFLLRPFLYRQKTFPSKQILPSLFIASFALRCMFCSPVSLTFGALSKVNQYGLVGSLSKGC